jgi:hypothetical protein
MRLEPCYQFVTDGEIVRAWIPGRSVLRVLGSIHTGTRANEMQKRRVHGFMKHASSSSISHKFAHGCRQVACVAAWRPNPSQVTVLGRPGSYATGHL